MRRLAILTAVLAVLAAIPAAADATTGFRRTITTYCLNGQIWALNIHTNNDWRTDEPCTEVHFDFGKQTYWYVRRPWTDFVGGDHAATHFYPACYHELDYVTDPGDGSYDQVFAFICP